MTSSSVIAEHAYDIASTGRAMWVRVYAPIAEAGDDWTCAYAIDEPVSVKGQARGESSLQALVEAFRAVSRGLYGSQQYKNQELLQFGEFDARLILPPTFDLGIVIDQYWAG